MDDTKEDGSEVMIFSDLSEKYYKKIS